MSFSIWRNGLITQSWSLQNKTRYVRCSLETYEFLIMLQVKSHAFIKAPIEIHQVHTWEKCFVQQTFWRFTLPGRLFWFKLFQKLGTGDLAASCTVKIGGSPMCWSSHSQCDAALSKTEAQYMMVGDCEETFFFLIRRCMCSLWNTLSTKGALSISSIHFLVGLQHCCKPFWILWFWN